MIKNKEFGVAVIFSVVCVIVGAVLISRNPSWSVGGMTIVSVLIFAAFAAVTRYRYRRIHELTDYLYELGQGETPLKIENYTEGELSSLYSEIYKLAGKLKEQAQLLEKDKNYLADAISDISHQLKTPLTSMSVMADLLKSDDLPIEKRREFTKNIQNQLNRMEWLLSSLLKMAKMDAGTITFKKAQVNVFELLNRSVQHLLIPMELMGVDFEIICDDDVVLTGDELWLKEALSNILKNCMEHTPAGGRVTAAAKKNALYTQICIEDTGNGIDSEDLPYIFDRFYKGKNASPDSVGIGLAMAKQIIQRSGGSIQVAKTGSSGTVFQIRFYK